jgi:arylsulfatase A-like enzyme
MPLRAADTDVILVIACTLRRDRIGAYGGKGTTPFFDRLAAAGALFERNIAQASWTRPSIGAILTGRWPRPLHLDNRGKRGKRGSLTLALDEGAFTFAEAMRAAGYRTVGAVSNPNAMGRFGFAQGFDDYLEPGGKYKSGAAIPSGDTLVDHVLDALDDTPAAQRFFGELLFTTTHHPRHPPRRYRSLFSELRPRLQTYDASLRALDAELARLYVGAKARRRNLLFIVVADHGEGLKEPKHHGKGHGNYLYPSSVQVPWLVQHPALPAGRRIGGLSMNIDLLPTTLELLGVPLPVPLDGRSEAAALRGERADAVHERAFAETYYMRTRKTTVIEADWQLTHDTRKDQRRLYSAADPLSREDHSVAEPEVAARLRGTLDAWEAEMDRVGAAGAETQAAPDAEAEALLQALGYVEEPDEE